MKPTCDSGGNCARSETGDFLIHKARRIKVLVGVLFQRANVGVIYM